MTPYYSRDGITLYHADCRDLLATLEPGSVDAVVSDPPFGARRPSARRSVSDRFGEIVGNEKIDAEWMQLAFIAAADSACLYSFCTWDTMQTWRLHAADAGWRVRSCIVWDKVVHGLADLATCWAPQHEFVLFGAKGRHELSGSRPADVIRCQRVSAVDLVHPYEKPVFLLQYIVSHTHGTVVDTHAGSCTTGVAAWNLGRKAILCEISEEYCELGAKRLDRVISQGRLFKPEPVSVVQKEMFGE